MKYQTFLPPPSLARLIRFFWVLESDQTTAIPYIYRSMADSCIELVFHYKGQFEEVTPTGTHPQRLALIHGPTQHFSRFVTYEHFGIFGVYLYPYALQQLFNIPTTGLSDQVVYLDEMLSIEGPAIEEQILLAKHHQERYQILVQFFSRQARKYEPSTTIPAIKAISYIIQQGGVSSVKDLAEQSYLSVRQFERKFKQYAGFSPKRYTRIVRFQRAMNEYGNHQKTLTQIAHECGYYDQSHFISDFKTFSGYSPKIFFAGKAEGIEFRDALE